jgi:sulfonate transport system substrate-binding protein
MRITRRTLLASAALASLAVPLLGCTDKPKTAASGRKRVRLTYSIISSAKTRGVFEQNLKDQGIDVEWIGPYPNHAPTIQAVSSGSADFSFGGSSTPALQAILSGSNKLKIVAWSKQDPRTTSIIVLPKSGIKTVPDLSGVAEFLLVAALEKYGVPRERVKVSYLNPPDAAPAFAAGQVDAWAIWHGALQMAEVQYGAQRIFEEGKEQIEAVDFGTYLVREDYAKQEPELVRKVVLAYQAEAAWASAHYAEAQTLANQVAKYPPAVLAKLIEQPISLTWQLFDDAGVAQLQRSADWLSERKILSGKLNVAEHVIRQQELA